MTAELVLLRAAKAAHRYFDNHVRGNGLNGQYDAITIGRELEAAIATAERSKPCDHCRTIVDVEPEPGRPVLCASCQAENDRQFEGRR